MIPTHAYIPGRTPRHPEGAFDKVRDSVRDGMDPQALAETQAFACGLRWLREGFYWEAHEVLEPVWMACPEAGAERALVQGLIQIANARLKDSMDRPRASARLRAVAAGLLERAEILGGPVVMGQVIAAWRDSLAAPK